VTLVIPSACQPQLETTYWFDLVLLNLGPWHGAEGDCWHSPRLLVDDVGLEDRGSHPIVLKLIEGAFLSTKTGSFSKRLNTEIQEFEIGRNVEITLVWCSARLEG